MNSSNFFAELKRRNVYKARRRERSRLIQFVKSLVYAYKYMPMQSPESASDIKFEIGHVLFIDIVGYSKLLITEQSEQLQKLKEIIRGAEQFRSAEAEGKLLRLPTGDGVALVFRTNPEAPVLCALEISEELRNHPELNVRMGIHSGPVNEVTDLNAQANIAGAGINIAQRVMDCGDAGHILFRNVWRMTWSITHVGGACLHDLGECEVKHGTRIHTFNLYTEHIGQCADSTEISEGQNGSDGKTVEDCGCRRAPRPVGGGRHFITAHIKASLSPTRTALFSRISRTRLVILFLTAHYDKDSPRSSSRHHFSLWSQIRSSPRP